MPSDWILRMMVVFGVGVKYQPLYWVKVNAAAAFCHWHHCVKIQKGQTFYSMAFFETTQNLCKHPKCRKQIHLSM